MKTDVSFEIETKLIGFIYIYRATQTEGLLSCNEIGHTKKIVIIPLESPLLSIKIPALETLDTNIITLQKKRCPQL